MVNVQVDEVLSGWRGLEEFLIDLIVFYDKRQDIGSPGGMVETSTFEVRANAFTF